MAADVRANQTSHRRFPTISKPYWMPFTANRAFKARAAPDRRAPRTCTTSRRTAASCSTAPPACGAPTPATTATRSSRRSSARRPSSTTRRPSSSAIRKAFELASRIAALAPGDLDHVFFCNSGSEAVDTALKIALAYHNVRGQGRAHAPDRPRARLSRRRLRRHLGRRHRQQPQAVRHAARRRRSPADDLQPRPSRPSPRASRNGARISPTSSSASSRCTTPPPSPAVIVEPMAGSTGVLPPPKGYLQRLRAICDKHGILLIFDEVITGFGRLGHAFAAERYGVVPDMITFAKGVTSGAVPMGGVIVRKGIYDAFMRGPEHVIEFFHGYTYSAHPLACAAGLATLDLYRDEDLFARAQEARAALGRRRDGAQGPAPRARHPLRRPRPPASTSRRGPTPSASAATRRWSAASTTRTSCSAPSATRSRSRRR